MQTQERRPPFGVAFDSSLEDSVDQVLALAMVYAYNFRREIRLGSITISRNNLRIAAFCDSLGRFFGANLPIGMFDKGPPQTDLPPMLSAVMSRAEADGKPLYPRAVEKFNDTADPLAAIRNALTAQQDQNATVILAGPPLNLLGVLSLPGNAELIQRKARSLVISAPFHDVKGLAELLAKWPGPVVVAGEDLNQTLRFPAQSIEKDFAGIANHPIVDAYRAAAPMPYDAPAAAMAAVLYALFPGEGYFGLSEPGQISITSYGQAQLRPLAQGNHRMLTADVEQRDKVVQTFRQVLSTKPPEPRRGARGPQP